MLCGTCNTENRDAAKFCKGCGRKIAQAWPQAPSPVVALVAGTDARTLLTGARLGANQALPVPAARREAPAEVPAPATEAAPAASAPEDVFTDFATPRTRISNGPWIVGVLVAVALLVGAAGWYGYKNSSVAVMPAATVPADAVSAASTAPAPTPEAPAATPPVASAPAVAAPAVMSEKIELAPAAPEAGKPAPKPRTAAAKKAAPPPVVVQVMPTPAPVAAPAPAPVVVQTPQGQCGGRNIVATAQCMADQCARGEFSGHGQCEAVRRQQRLEEEKRNPSLLN